MKPLKPSMREKKRYLLVRGKNLRENVKKAILEFVGVRGMSKACLNFIEDKGDAKNSKNFGASRTKDSQGLAIVSVDRKAVDFVRASLAVYPEKMEVVRVSGTLKSLKALRSRRNFDRKGLSRK